MRLNSAMWRLSAARSPGSVMWEKGRQAGGPKGRGVVELEERKRTGAGVGRERS